MSESPFHAIVAGTASVIAPMIAEMNSLKATHSALYGANPEALIQDHRDIVETTDEAILEYRAWFSKVSDAILQRQTVIEEHIRKNVIVVPEDAPSEEELKTAFNDKQKAVSAALKLIGQLGVDNNTLISVFGSTKTESGEDIPALPVVPSLRGSRGAGKPASSVGGSGIRRPRVDHIAISIDGENYVDAGISVKGKVEGTTETRFTFSGLAKTLTGKPYSMTNVDVTTLQSAAFSAAGTEDLSTVNGVIDFVFESGDKRVYIRVTPSKG